MTLLDRLYKLMDGYNIKPSALTKELGISTSSFTDWKKGKGTPSLDAVIKFANYFGVSLNYLVFGDEHESLEISGKTEMELLKSFRKLNPDCQLRVISYTNGMVDALSSDTSSQMKN